MKARCGDCAHKPEKVGQWCSRGKRKATLTPKRCRKFRCAEHGTVLGWLADHPRLDATGKVKVRLYDAGAATVFAVATGDAAAGLSMLSRDDAVMLRGRLELNEARKEVTVYAEHLMALMEVPVSDGYLH
jgi:hypothetical protein